MRRLPGFIALLVVLALALSAPFWMSGYRLFQFAQVLIYAIALIGLNLLTGFSGQISLGHGAFFAIGGYGAAILIVKAGLPLWLAIPIAGAACFILGFLFGFPALRLGGLYLALATFALAIATPQLLAFKRLDFLTGGSEGLQVPKPSAAFGLNVDQSVYVICLIAAIVFAIVAGSLVRGRIGRALIAIRDHPTAASTMGVDVALYKTLCFGVSALYAGVAGGLDAVTVGFVSPESFGLPLSLAFLVGVVVGGLASIEGMFFGALFIVFVPNYADQLTVFFGENAKALPGAVYGVLLILMMAAAPLGAAGLIGRVTRALKRG